MAGVGDQGRRLRGREVPAPPVTRSAALAAATCNANQLENPRRTKTAPKRAAIDDHNRMTSAAPAQHAKKRAALANLTNYSNACPNRNNAQICKAQAVTQVGAAKGKTRTAAVKVESAELVEQNPERDTAVDSYIISQDDENVCPGGIATALEVKAETFVLVQPGGNENKALASLERKTQHNLYISKDSKTRARQGYLFEEHVEGEGWSSQSYSDIDNDQKDPQMCSSYATDIYHHLRMAELKRRPGTDFMEAVQQDINSSMRGILVDWLVEVAEEYKLVPDTLYLTVSYIDRFLSGNVVTRQRLQLLGVSCMLIASKYEEICAPQVEEFCYITDNTYNREEVLEMERRVLNHLHFELTGPTTKSFLRRFIRAAQAGNKTPTLQLEFLGNYLAELTLVEYSFLKYPPSMIAGSSVFMAKATLEPASKPWNSTLQHYSGYKPSELKECVKAIHDLQCNKKNCTLPAIREKYRQHKFKCVATVAAPAFIPPEFFVDLEGST